jgi:hypothetical protein
MMKSLNGVLLFTYIPALSRSRTRLCSPELDDSGSEFPVEELISIYPLEELFGSISPEELIPTFSLEELFGAIALEELMSI